MDATTTRAKAHVQAQAQAPAARPGKKSGARRCREFRRYAEAVLTVASRDGEIAISSIDIPLTAFAQLVALRLQAKRVLVSLFDGNFQYVLAEATSTLSLQQDSHHDEGDGIFFGANVLPRADDWFSETLRAARKLTTKGAIHENTAALILPDLLRDERYAQHKYVVNEPFVRSYMGVPLLTPKGYPIGTLSVLDDKARPDGVEGESINVMRDIAASIMTHLELARTRATHARALRMTRGISMFMEGKGSLDAVEDDAGHSDPDALSKRQKQQNENLGASTRTHALNAATNDERMVDAREAVFARTREGPSASNFSKRSRGSSADRGHSNAKHSAMRPEGSATHASQGDISPVRESATPPPVIVDGTDKLHPITQPPTGVRSTEITQAFSRAANLILEAMDMTGVMFLDASEGSFGSLRNMDDPEATSSSSDTDSLHSRDGSDGGYEQGARSSSGRTTAVCRCIAAAQRTDHHGHAETNRHVVSEKFLRSMLKRFPYGKIYNFDGDTVLASSEQSDTTSASGDLDSTSATTKSPTRRRRHNAQSDAEAILEAFPGTRSFAVVPMWDGRRARFYAGAVVWSYDDTRLLSYQEDFNYLSAFCDMLMAEVGRLDIQSDAQAKTSFIESISHELRSPLHGILGASELLQEARDDKTTREEMVQMIDTCGRSLLDVVNNLLEHALITSATTKSRKRKRRGSILSIPARPSHNLEALAEEVLKTALWKTPKPLSRSKSSSILPVGTEEGESYPLKVVLHLENQNLPSSGWNFHVNAIAFRRIFQNLVTNAINFTEYGGYLHCALSICGNTSQPGGALIVGIECTDTGRGISKDYLESGLWEAFSQGDAHVQGAGLGLSLVWSLVNEMNGTIDVHSEEGKGSTFKVSLPLVPADLSADDILHGDSAKAIAGMSYGLFGFDAEDGRSARTSESIYSFKAAIDLFCSELGLKNFETGSESIQNPAVCIVTESHAMATARDSTAGAEPARWQTLPCLILCDSVRSSRSTLAALAISCPHASILAQPLTLRRLLHAIMESLEWRRSLEHNDLRVSQEEADNPGSFAGEPTPFTEKLQTDWTTDVVKPEESGLEQQDLKSPTSKSSRPFINRTASAVLLVDDNAVNLRLLQRYMSKLDRKYINACDGQEALEAYQDSRPQQTPDSSGPTADLPVSVIFMDITMPVMDGLESSRRIRAYERAHGLKPAVIVALTALATPSARQEAYSSGVDLFLTKPVRFGDIEQMFKDWEKDAG